MTKIKGILAIGVILLFLGVIFNPVTAQTTIPDKVQEKMEVMNISSMKQLQLTNDEITSMQKFLPELIEKISAATSVQTLLISFKVS